MKRKKGYKPLPVSKNNKSRRPSKAKVEAAKRKTKSTDMSMSRKARKPKKAKVKRPNYSYRLSGLNPKTPKQLPETDQTRKGMTLRQLLRSTPKLMINNSIDVELVEKRVTRTRSGMPALKAVAITNDPYRPNKVRRKHNTFIIGAELDKENNPVKKPINRHKKVIVSCSCLTGDTKVLTSKGWKTIYELAEEFDPENLKVTYIVDGKKHQGTAPYYTGKKKVFTLKLSNGSKVVATNDHRFLVKPTRGEPVWQELKDISVGDNILLSKTLAPKLPEKTNSFYVMQFLGFMQGDGTLTSPVVGSPDLQIYNDDKMPMIDKFSELGVIEDTYTTDRGAERVRFNHKAVEYMRRHGYDNVNAVNWRTKEEFYGYLSGLICADASVSSKDGKILSLQIRGAESYIRSVYETLHRCGYSSTSMRLERKKGTTLNVIRGSGSDGAVVSRKDLYCLTIPAKTFSHLRDYLELTPRFYAYDFKEFRDFRLPLAKVVEKFYSKHAHVYDITVPGIHKFVIDGSVVSHNCENYVFTFEYANAASGASRIVYGNGDPPVVTNPSMATGLCKHLVKAARTLIKSES